MTYDDEITIAAPPDHVWSVYSDVEHWPDWTTSVRSVRFVDGTALAPGTRAWIKQPKLPPARWEVVGIEPGRSWTWVARAPGLRTTAVHTVEPSATGGTRVHMSLEQAGPLGRLMGRLYARLTRRYLAMEAAGLKQRCETTAAA